MRVPEAQEFKKHFEEAMAHNEKVLAHEDYGEDEVCTPKPMSTSPSSFSS